MRVGLPVGGGIVVIGALREGGAEVVVAWYGWIYSMIGGRGYMLGIP